MKLERNRQFIEQYPHETETVKKARKLSQELGIEPVTKTVAATLAVTSALLQANAICEVGTGVGVSGLALTRYRQAATLTSLELDGGKIREAKTVFNEGGLTGAKLRLVEGDARHIMPKLNTESYDLVFIDANPEQVLDFFEAALKIVRPGGAILVADALAHGKVADPANRDAEAQAMRDLVSVVNESETVAPALSEAGNGLLTVVKLRK